MKGRRKSQPKPLPKEAPVPRRKPSRIWLSRNPGYFNFVKTAFFLASYYWLIFLNVFLFFLSQGLKAGKSLPASFLQALGYVHNRVEEEIKVMQGYLLQVVHGDLSLKEFEVRRDEWKRLQAFQVQCCLLTSKDSWMAFCDEFLSCNPADAYSKIKYTLSALPPLPSGQVDEAKK